MFVAVDVRAEGSSTFGVAVQLSDDHRRDVHFVAERPSLRDRRRHQRSVPGSAPGSVPGSIPGSVYNMFTMIKNEQKPNVN